MTDRLRFVILTPHETVFDGEVDSARVPTETGLVGLRPRAEPLLMAIEPGLILVRTGETLSFAATAGGLFEGDRERAVLYTPFAVTGEEPDQLLAAMDHALALPDSEIAARRRLDELEDRIIEELRGPRSSMRPTRTHHV